MRISRTAITSTLVCVLGCEPFDSQPYESTQDSVTDACCAGLGTWVLEGFVSQPLAARLPRADCQDSLLCVPTAWLLDPTRGPDSCRAQGDLEGRCLPACLPEVFAFAERLQQGSCQAGSLCKPCYDPLTGEDTEACHIEPDLGPSEPPPILP